MNPPQSQSVYAIKVLVLGGLANCLKVFHLYYYPGIYASVLLMEHRSNLEVINILVLGRPYHAATALSLQVNPYPTNLATNR
jgi:hypothetical protein